MRTALAGFHLEGNGGSWNPGAGGDGWSGGGGGCGGDCGCGGKGGGGSCGGKPSSGCGDKPTGGCGGKPSDGGGGQSGGSGQLPLLPDYDGQIWDPVAGAGGSSSFMQQWAHGNTVDAHGLNTEPLEMVIAALCEHRGQGVVDCHSAGEQFAHGLRVLRLDAKQREQVQALVMALLDIDWSHVSLMTGDASSILEKANRLLGSDIDDFLDKAMIAVRDMRTVSEGVQPFDYFTAVDVPDRTDPGCVKFAATICKTKWLCRTKYQARNNIFVKWWGICEWENWLERQPNGENLHVAGCRCNATFELDVPALLLALALGCLLAWYFPGATVAMIRLAKQLWDATKGWSPVPIPG